MDEITAFALGAGPPEKRIPTLSNFGVVIFSSSELQVKKMSFGISVTMNNNNHFFKAIQGK